MAWVHSGSCHSQVIGQELQQYGDVAKERVGGYHMVKIDLPGSDVKIGGRDHLWHRHFGQSAVDNPAGIVVDIGQMEAVEGRLEGRLGC